MKTVLNTRGRIASLCPSDTNEIQLYVVPALTEIDGVLRVCNKNGVTCTFSVAHCTAGHGNVSAGDSDWLFYRYSLVGNTTIEISIHAGPTETVRVASGTGSYINFHLSGNTKLTTEA